MRVVRPQNSEQGTDPPAEASGSQPQPRHLERPLEIQPHHPADRRHDGYLGHLRRRRQCEQVNQVGADLRHAALPRPSAA